LLDHNVIVTMILYSLKSEHYRHKDTLQDILGLYLYAATVIVGT